MIVSYDIKLVSPSWLVIMLVLVFELHPAVVCAHTDTIYCVLGVSPVTSKLVTPTPTPCGEAGIPSTPSETFAI